MNRRVTRRAWCVGLSAVCLMSFGGCSKEGRALPLDPEKARGSLETAMQAWADGKKPADLKPGITMGDYSWDTGSKLVSFKILKEKESSDGNNLYLPVACELRSANGKLTKVETIYIIGTYPTVTIFPQ